MPTSATTFVPVLTVLAEAGGPFIWLTSRPDQQGVGPCLCDGMGWDESMPLSEGLFIKFADWQDDLESALREAGYFSPDMPAYWDWAAFHKRGMQLARWLKEEVGNAYRVVYCKTGEDHAVSSSSERTELLMDGSLRVLPPFPHPAATTQQPFSA